MSTTEIEPKQGNVPVPAPMASPAVRRARAQLHRDDLEFLPAALEILERPPSPVKLALILTICGFCAAGLAWSFIGRIDIVAVAQGKFQPAGRVKVVQSLENGRVARIAVANGDEVKAGDVLVELDPAQVRAELAGYEAALTSTRAEIARRRAAAAAAAPDSAETPGSESAVDPGRAPFPTVRPQPIAFAPDTPAEIEAREEKVLSADLLALMAQLSTFSAQREQKQRERDGLAKTIDAQENLLDTLQARVDMREKLLASNVGSKASVIDARENLQYHKTVLAERRGQLEAADAAAGALTRNADKVLRDFVASNSQKLAEAERQAEDLEQRVARSRARLGQMTLLAPIAGTVQASAITSPGQVLTTGQEMMRIVPNGANLEIEAYLANKDIGFVSPGQVATIKVESFPFTRYGTVPAEVVRVGRDAIPEPDARQMEGDPARTSLTNAFAGAQRIQNLVFPVTLAPGKDSIEVDGHSVSFQPGMAVSVEIKTGSRRIIDYVISPLVEVSSQSMKER